MASHTWLYFINEREFASHEVVIETRELIIKKSKYPSLFAKLGITDKVVKTNQKEVEPASRQSSGKTISLPDWIFRETSSSKNKGDEGEELVAGYLFERDPGMFWAGDFRHEWAFDEDLRLLTHNLPDLSEKLSIKERGANGHRNQPRTECIFSKTGFTH